MNRLAKRVTGTLFLVGAAGGAAYIFRRARSRWIPRA
jgi:hypothetical protein